MNDLDQHINHYANSTDSGVLNMLEGMGQFVNGVKIMYGRSLEEKEHYRQQAEANRIEPANIVPDGKQKALIAIFNVIYKAGYVSGISQKEFMERVATLFGCPGMANYSQALYNIKTAYKYDEIFEGLLKVAKEEKIG